MTGEGSIMLLVAMRGNGLERGKAHAGGCKSLILRAYEELCVPIALSPEEKERHVGSFLECLSAASPDLFEEIHGIAIGSGLSVNQVAELTLWEELKFMSKQQTGDSQCTAIAFTITPDGPVVGKTTDIEDFQRPYYILQRIDPIEGYSMLSLGKAGSVKTEVGVNEKGLCVATGSLLPSDKGKPELERMTLARIVLQMCSNVDEAVTLLSKYNLVRLGLYFLLVDATGKACVVEKGVAHQGLKFPESNGVIFATNFYSTPEMMKYMDRSAFYYVNALERYVNLLNLVKSGLLYEGVDGMKKILRDHSTIGPICAHFEDIGMCTFFASIILPREGKFMITDGYPCQEEFQEFSIRQL